MDRHRADRVQLGLFDQRPVAVDRLRTEEGDVLAPLMAEGLFRFLCATWPDAPFLSIYRISLTAPAGEVDDLHEAAEGFASDVASASELSGAFLVEDAAPRGEGMGDRHYYGAVVTPDARPVVRDLWTERTGASLAAQRVTEVGGSDQPWERSNWALQKSLRAITGYGLRAKTPLSQRHVVMSGPMSRLWDQARVNVTINIHVHPAGSVTGVAGSVTGSVAKSVTSGGLPRAGRVRRTVDRGERFCLVCGKPIPSERKWGTMYDADACKVAASRSRHPRSGKRAGGAGSP